MNARRLIVALLVSMTAAGSAAAQHAEDAAVGPAVPVRKAAADTSEQSVPGAVIRSALLPGFGQWYNGKRLKAVAVFGIEAGLIGAAVVQNQRAVRSTTETERVFYEDDRSRFIWYAAAFWLLQVFDAHVDAKLRPFDISDNLSLETRVTPGIEQVALVYRF
ncbi:hypothetical protein JXO52_17725 [bacterium]|nr:hypothetical protein [bacterium]